MSKTAMFRNTCSIACACTSPPGVPMGIGLPSGRIASAGLGVSRGRLPGATDDACAGSAQFCEPREDGHKPVPGITGVSNDVSLGVAENTFPSLSITQTYEVSRAPGAGPSAAGNGTWRRAKPGISPQGGISGQATSGRSIARRCRA
jgi:hypothetical protein